MPALPFNPVDLAPVFPDVLWAVGIALILAVVTSRPPKPLSPEETLLAMGYVSATVVTDEGEDDGS